MLIPVLLCLTTWHTRSSGLLSAVLAILLSWVALAIVGRKLYLQVKHARNYRLGFDSKRYVAEELTRLIAHQYEIFHDVPFDGFNDDHVLVGFQGVFAMETKTRRKPRSAGRTEGNVKFDGSCLRWPWGADTYGLQQAANNARTISQFLSEATGQSVFVQPILTLPGWWVDRTVPRSPVWVLNPKEIIGACKDAPPQLSSAAMRAIVYQLERHCKIVQD